MEDYENAKACLNHAKQCEALGDHHKAMVLFGRGECLAGHESTKRKCARGVKTSLKHLEEQLSGKYEWAEIFRADPDALLGSPKTFVHLPLTAYSEPVTAVMGRFGRGLAVRRDVAIGDLLFVDKAWVVGNYEDLLDAAMKSLEDCSDLQLHRLMELYDGTNGANPLMEKLLPGRVARNVPLDHAELDEERLQRILRFNAITRWSLLDGELSSTVKGDDGDGNTPGTTGTGYAAGLWCLASFVNHSCRPNVNFTFLGDVLTCRATRNLKAGDELLVGYVRLDRPLLFRRKELSATFDFHCTCHRCILEEALVPDGSKYLQQIERLTQVPSKDKSFPWIEAWSSLYRQIEYEISLSIKQRGKELDQDLSLANSLDALFEKSWTPEHDQQREERLKHQEELRNNIARLQGQAKPVGFEHPGREDVYSLQLQRLLCGSYSSVAMESARLWREVASHANSARDCFWVCQQLEEICPASSLHAHWAGAWATRSWKHFMREERLNITKKLPPSPMPSELLRAASYARRSYSQCFGPRLWLPQAQQLGWPIQLVAASLREEVVVKLPPRKPKQTAPRRRMKCYKAASVCWNDARHMQVEMEEVHRPTLPETEAMSEFSAALQSLFQVM